MNPFIYQEDYPVVQTKEGALRGYEWKGTCIFKGIPYAHAQRFRKPERVKPWDGVKDVQSYGYVSPLLHPEQPGGNGEMMVPHMYWPEKEDCQNLNIWTPSIRDGRKRPVMVWLHGGGFSAGSSIEQLAYDGENLSRSGDVVVVSVNHRLNVLGYLDLSPFGEKYRDSANAGNLDLIAALEWIRDNIEGFGGDPENVTLFGQSGGGVKVWSLLQMPEADGLFHKGIIESGVVDPDLLGDAEDGNGREIVKAMLAELGLEEKDVDQLESLPYDQLAQAYENAAPKVAQKGEYVGNFIKQFPADNRRMVVRHHPPAFPWILPNFPIRFIVGDAVIDHCSCVDWIFQHLCHENSLPCWVLYPQGVFQVSQLTAACKRCLDSLHRQLLCNLALFHAGFLP